MRKYKLSIACMAALTILVGVDQASARTGIARISYAPDNPAVQECLSYDPFKATPRTIPDVAEPEDAEPADLVPMAPPGIAGPVPVAGLTRRPPIRVPYRPPLRTPFKPPLF